MKRCGLGEIKRLSHQLLHLQGHAQHSIRTFTALVAPGLSRLRGYMTFLFSERLQILVFSLLVLEIALENPS